jgi:hypothetical protein
VTPSSSSVWPRAGSGICRLPSRSRERDEAAITLRAGKTYQIVVGAAGGYGQNGGDTSVYNVTDGAYLVRLQGGQGKAGGNVLAGTGTAGGNGGNGGDTYANGTSGAANTAGAAGGGGSGGSCDWSWPGSGGQGAAGGAGVSASGTSGGTGYVSCYAQTPGTGGGGWTVSGLPGNYGGGGGGGARCGSAGIGGTGGDGVIAIRRTGICGNGTIDWDEQCETGGCCTSTCQFAVAGSVCRAATGACDATETCSGTASTCPADALVPAGDVGSPSCAPYACSGTSVSCATSCTTTADCAYGYSCLSGTCALQPATITWTGTSSGSQAMAANAVKAFTAGRTRSRSTTR